MSDAVEVLKRIVLRNYFLMLCGDLVYKEIDWNEMEAGKSE